MDDLLIGAPGASPDDELGDPVSGGGQVYAILGGTGLVGAAHSGVIELSRIANGASPLPGFVFLGGEPGGEIGRSVTGLVDLDGDGTADICFGGNGQAWMIPGNDPKVIIGSSRTGGGGSFAAQPLSTVLNAVEDLDAVRYVPETPGNTDQLIVAYAGNVNDDTLGSGEGGDERELDDLIIGAPGPDPTLPGCVDPGKAYIIYGSPDPAGPEVPLGDVGSTVAGLTIVGVESCDQLGAAVGGGTDVNGDGIDDALIGAPYTDAGVTPPDAGKAYVVSPMAPNEAPALSISVSGEVLWSRVDRDLGSNVYRGLLSELRSAGVSRTFDMMQLTCNASPASTYTDGTSPPPGDAFYYLVTATNAIGEGPLSALTATTRINDLQCPYP